MAKLQNVKAIKEMLAGTHKTQTKTTIGFDNKEFVRREVGEQWTDEFGNRWEQKKGYKVKLGKLSEVRKEVSQFSNCPKEVCTCTTPSTADKKMMAYHGMCLECVTDMETTLKLEGKYKDYERNKLLQDANAWLKQAEIEKEILKTALKAQYVLEDGRIEEWEGGMSPEELEAKIDAEFEKFKTEFIAKLENGND